MDYTVSDAVKELVSEMHFLRFPLQEDLINYSALARFLKPMVESRVGEEVSLDAIVMALKKNSEILHSEPFHVFETLVKTKFFLRTGISLLHFHRTEELYQKLIEFQHHIDWSSGEKMYLLQRSDELSVIALSKYESELLALSGKSNLIKKYSGMALVTLQFPEEYFDSSGILEYLSRQFSDLGVSITEIFTSHDKLSIVFEEDKASAVYEKLTNTVKTSREILDLDKLKKKH